MLTSDERERARSNDVFDKVRAIDLQPRFPQQTGPADVRSGAPIRSESYYGTATPAVIGAQQTQGGDGFELNFENTPVTTVAKVILGDILGLGYSIDPRVQGTVSLASGRPVPKGDLLYVLESALRMSNVALVREGRMYRIIPGTDAIGTGAVDRATGRLEPGYGITVVPLQHVSAPTVLKLLDSFAVKPGTVRADPARNMLIIQGSSNERRAAIETVMSFDADWMRGQSVGIYPLRNSAPEAIIGELERIIDAGEGGLSQNFVKLQPIARLNAIMVVTSKPGMLRTTATWISRLDKSDTASIGVKVYRVRYGDAKQLSGLLNEIFTGRAAASGLDAATNQIAPGAGLTTVTSDRDRMTGSRTPSLTGGPSLRAPGGPATAATGTETPGAPGAPGTTTFGDRFGDPSRGSLFGRTSTSAVGGPGPGGPAILPNVRITADTANNTLLIYASQEHYRLIEQTLRQLDRPQLQVAIDATIAEITLNDSLSYGVQAFIKSSDIGLRPDYGSAVVSATASSVLARALPGFNLLLGPELEPRLIIDALRGVTDVKILSNPALVVLDNQTATLQVGDQVPIATATATVLASSNNPIVNTIDYRNTGIILRVVPRINVNGNVLLDIEQEISNVSNNANAQTLTPTVSQRKVKSSIAVANGQTVLLAGLISDRQEKSRSGLPLIDQLGELGKMFGSNTRANTRTELIIFIRPQIIRDSVDATRIAEELRAKLSGKIQPTVPDLFPQRRPVQVPQ